MNKISLEEAAKLTRFGVKWTQIMEMGDVKFYECMMSKDEYEAFTSKKGYQVIPSRPGVDIVVPMHKNLAGDDIEMSYQDNRLIMSVNKFARLKKARKNGADIEYYNELLKSWCDTEFPIWNTEVKYRVKCENKK